MVTNTQRIKEELLYNKVIDKVVDTEEYDEPHGERILKKICELIYGNRNHKERNTETNIPEKHIELMNTDNVCMIISKTHKAKMLLSKIPRIERTTPIRQPELDYTTTNIPTCRYSTDYIHMINQVLFTDEKDDKTRITMKEDYPATIENTNFKILLAPVVERYN